MNDHLTGLLARLAPLLLVMSACDDEAVPVPPGPPVLPSVSDVMSSLPQSCAFECADCPEPSAAYACPAAAPWSELPHAEECDSFDGAFPAPPPGQCTVSDAAGEAARKAGPIPGGFVLPDGHRILPAGRHVLLDDDLQGGFPMNMLAVPGTRLAVLTDGGIADNALRVIDLDAMASGAEPVVSQVAFPRPQSLFYGLAFLAPARLFASGGGDGLVYAFDLDLASGALSRFEAADLDLGGADAEPWYVGPIAPSADGSRLVIAPSESAQEVAVVSLAAANYGERLATIDLDDSHAIYDLRADPFDPAGKLFYASNQSKSRLLEIDAVAGSITRTIALAKNPAQLAFLDARYLVVAEANGDSLALVDRIAGEVALRAPVFEPGSPRGFSPNALAFHAASSTLFATLAGVNAVEAYAVSASTPPTIVPKGRVPTAWWPTSVIVDSDGSLVVASGKGEGTGTDGEQYPWSQGPITDRMRGSIQYVPAGDLTDLRGPTAVVDANESLGDIDGRPEVSCPDGVDDFPIPLDPSLGPSAQIKHVILLVRENKTYDAVFGDRADLGDGDPSLIMASDAELQQNIWQNVRSMAAAFTNFDNFYTDAEQSIQGHVWTAYGRTTDYIERTWLTTWGRGTRPVTAVSVASESFPEEGGIFVWLDREGVAYDDMGELVSESPQGLDSGYPGFAYAQDLPDLDKSCYMAGRIRLLCDLKPFTYAVQPNDHTNGGAAGSAAPEVMIAVNDEATGLLLDALSHSPRWKDTLLIVTEDDPQDGGDHVDLHRTVLVMASPWVRRGYVSSGHYDMGSVHKLIAHIFGIPYNNEATRSALLPLDAFTSTPDYTPYDVVHRTVDAPCNPAETKEAKEAEGWDFSEPDEQPGLSEQIERMLRRPRAERRVQLVAPGTRR